MQDPARRKARLVLFVMAAAIQGCVRHEPATVTIRSANLEGSGVEIWDERRRIATFQETPFAAKGLIDSTGVYEATLNVTTPGVYWLMLRPRGGSAMLYLHPGQNLEISVDGSDWSGSLAFEGDFAGEQAAFQRIQRLGWQGAPGGLDTLDTETFVRHALAFERGFRDGIAAQLDSAAASEEFSRHVAAWADARLYYTRKNYEFMQERAGRRPLLPEGLFDGEAVLAKHADLIGEVPEIRRIADAPIQDSVSKFIRLDPPLDSDIDWQTYYRLDRIDEGPDDFRRPYLYAMALVNYVALAGTTPRVDSVIAEYGDRLVPRDREVLDAVYGSYKVLENRPAPDFEFFLPDSTRMRLSDLRGKVVYIDVWATWCGPCLVEMPFSNALRTKYAGRDDMVFLYVSVDDNQEAWHTMLRDRTDFGGLHGITGIGWDGPLTKEYRITGIPRTILVDRDGLLVRVAAPSPSSDEIAPLLDRVLGPS